MWNIIKMLKQDSDISQQERHLRLMNEFDKFVAVEGESLASVSVEFPSLDTLNGKPVDGLTLDSNKPCNNSPGVSSSYTNITGKPIRKIMNFCTLFTSGGKGVDVVVPVESIRAISERFANRTYGFFLGERMAYPVVANYVRNT
ncbi:hypothetical protein Tco_1303482 [Tanacetum coccineum]